MEAVHTEIHLTTDAGWPALLEQLLHDRQLPSLLIAPTTPYGQRFTAHCAGREGLPTLKAYDRPVEDWKDELFNDTPASLTGTLGAHRLHRQSDHVADPRGAAPDEPGAAGALRHPQGQ